MHVGGKLSYCPLPIQVSTFGPVILNPDLQEYSTVDPNNVSLVVRTNEPFSSSVGVWHLIAENSLNVKYKVYTQE